MQHHTGALLAYLYKGFKTKFPPVGEAIDIEMRKPKFGSYKFILTEDYGTRLKILTEGYWSCTATIYVESKRDIRIEHDHGDTVEKCRLYIPDNRVTDGEIESEDGKKYIFRSEFMDMQRVLFQAQDKQLRPETKEYIFK